MVGNARAVKRRVRIRARVGVRDAPDDGTRAHDDARPEDWLVELDHRAVEETRREDLLRRQGVRYDRVGEGEWEGDASWAHLVRPGHHACRDHADRVVELELLERTVNTICILHAGVAIHHEQEVDLLGSLLGDVLSLGGRRRGRDRASLRRRLSLAARRTACERVSRISAKSSRSPLPLPLKGIF